MLLHSEVSRRPVRPENASHGGCFATRTAGGEVEAAIHIERELPESWELKVRSTHI